MLKVTYVEVDVKDESHYSYMYCSHSDTPAGILAQKGIDPETRNVYLNGKQVSNQKMNVPFSNYNLSDRCFLTVKFRFIH